MSTRIRTRVAASSTGPTDRVSGEGPSNPQLDVAFELTESRLKADTSSSSGCTPTFV